jgi:hypothetical protein
MIELAVFAGLGATVLRAFGIAWRAAADPVERAAVRNTVLYFLAQTLSAAVAIYSTRLYIIALATHRVEYQIPRAHGAAVPDEAC